MDIQKFGLVIAQPEKNISELERFTASDEAEIFIFPEGYLHSDQLSVATRVAKANGKWIITGMDDYREPGKKYETAIVINPAGKIVGEHKKTSLTDNEIKNGYSRGDSINVIETPFGKIGLAICYEIHFPEISRIYALQGADYILNPVGTGMWHEHQFKLWHSVARARASENGIFVLGCSHFNDTIPFAFAYAPDSECLIESRDVNKLIPISIIHNKYTVKKNYNHRRPELYSDITKINSHK